MTHEPTETSETATQPRLADEADDTTESARETRPGSRGGRSRRRHAGDEGDAATGRRRSSEGRRERTDGHRHREGRSRGRRRAQRGDVRAAVLVLLAEEPMHGYQLMQAIADRTQGAWRPSPGAIYPTIGALTEEGLVSVVEDAGRKLATLTESGRSWLTDNAAAGDPFAVIAAQARNTNDLRGCLEQVADAARTVDKTGSDTQIAMAQRVLTQARRDLYLILADAPAEAFEVSEREPETSA